jgi:hypothetical protein
MILTCDFSDAERLGFKEAVIDVYNIPTNDQVTVEDYYCCCEVHFKRSAVRIQRNAAVVPADKEMEFYDLTMRLLVNQPLTKKKKNPMGKKNSMPLNLDGTKTVYYPLGMSIHKVSSRGKQPVCISCKQAIARGQLRVVNKIITNESKGYKRADSIHHNIQCLTGAVGEAEATRILTK